MDYLYIFIFIAVSALSFVAIFFYLGWVERPSRSNGLNSNSVSLSGVHSIKEGVIKRHADNIDLFMEAEDRLAKNDIGMYIALKEEAIKMAKKAKAS